jgi:hypothetical protein
MLVRSFSHKRVIDPHQMGARRVLRKPWYHKTENNFKVFIEQ